jgi:hypothetical protein
MVLNVCYHPLFLFSDAKVQGNSILQNIEPTKAQFFCMKGCFSGMNGLAGAIYGCCSPLRDRAKDKNVTSGLRPGHKNVF